MGNYPSMGTKGGTVIGGLELNISYSYMPCCGGRGTTAARLRLRALAARASTPTGPEWEKAKDGFAPFLEEGAAIAFKSGAPLSCVQGGCVQCGCMDAVQGEGRARRGLDQPREHVPRRPRPSGRDCAFYVSDGKSSTPHLFIQFSKPA